ncbi:MAG: hypothetical protein ACK5JQ_06600, partial [Bacteroidota bacterium]
YTDPISRLLRNKQDITDPEVLLFVESVAVTKRLQELYENPIKIEGIDSLFEIHKHLFQDIYNWAGKKRNVEISKDGKQFFPTTHFDNAFRYIDWRKLKQRLKEEGNETVTNCHGLKMLAPDGKMRMTDVAIDALEIETENEE